MDRASAQTALDMESRKPVSRRDPAKVNAILDTWTETPHPSWYDHGSETKMSWAHKCWEANSAKVSRPSGSQVG